MILAAALLVGGRALSQSTLAVVGGYGMANARLYPSQEMRAIWGSYSGGLSWRYYSAPRFVGCIGVDVEWMQRGFSYAPYASQYEDKKQYKYYTRNLNSIMVPIVWQPHVYMFKNHMRVYMEAALTFSYNFSSTYDNEETGVGGKYEFRSVRDNRFNYGLAGGAGIDILVKQFEIGIRARYYFGYSDLMKNRNKFYDNQNDNQNANPFYYTPLRSPLDNLAISIKIGYRFNKEGFKEWTMKRQRKNKNEEVFKYAL